MISSYYVNAIVFIQNPLTINLSIAIVPRCNPIQFQ
jgi:hypothetical protein